MHPLLILAVGVFSIIFLIAALRLNAFLALIVSAILVSLLAPGPFAEKITRVATAFGSTAGSIGIVIALAVVIGKCMMDSGAADRIVRGFLALLGQKRCSWALMSSGFILSIPVFFDTVFYLLVPLARSTCRRTGGNYLKYATAIVAGGVITHSLVPPTPGPLLMADQLGIDLGVMILYGALIAAPCTLVGMAYSVWIDRRLNIAMRPLGAGMEEADPLADEQLPPLALSLTPIVLPVLLVSMNTIICAVAKKADDDTALCRRVAEVMGVLGNVNFAMLASTAVAMWMLKTKRRLTNVQLGKVVESSLMSGGMIILITAAGGAFGAMLKAAEIGPAIEALFTRDAGGQTGGVTLLLLGALIACIVKIAQGSGTVAMITASAMIAAMITPGQDLGYPTVLLATAIGGASMMGSWMNDSGFWIFVKMTGLTETEGLKCWTPLLAVTGFTSVVVSLILALSFAGGHADQSSISGALPPNPRDLPLWANSMVDQETRRDLNSVGVASGSILSRGWTSARIHRGLPFHAAGAKRKMSGVWGQSPQGHSQAEMATLTQRLETHARHKQQVLRRLQEMPRLVLMTVFGGDFREAWRHVLIDGSYAGQDKQEFLQGAMKRSEGISEAIRSALAALLKSHLSLFDYGRDTSLAVRYAGDPTFKPFGRHMTAAQALTEMTAGNEAEVQAFQTIFETGQNTRGYVHKLECHGQAIEFIYAITDIVYGVMRPAELDFAEDKVTADSARVQMFYVKAGEVIALHPYVLHSGSLSVEPDRSFSILIYKKPAGTTDQVVQLPPVWSEHQECIKIAGVDKFYLTLEGLHTNDLKTNRGFIAGEEPLRLPNWE